MARLTRAYTSTLYTSQVFHKSQTVCVVLGKDPRGGLLFVRHEPPLTRRFVVYYCSAVYRLSFQSIAAQPLVRAITRSISFDGIAGKVSLTLRELSSHEDSTK